MDTDPPIAAPDDMSPAALALWNEAAAWLHERHLVKGIEWHSLARYCEYAAIWSACRAAMRDRRTSSGIRTTYTTKSAHGTMQRQRPEWRTMLDAEREMRQLSDRFGLTPSARASLLARLATARDPAAGKPSQTPGLGKDAANPASSTMPATGTSPIGTLGRTRPH